MIRFVIYFLFEHCSIELFIAIRQSCLFQLSSVFLSNIVHVKRRIPRSSIKLRTRSKWTSKLVVYHRGTVWNSKVMGVISAEESLNMFNNKYLLTYVLCIYLCVERAIQLSVRGYKFELSTIRFAVRFKSEDDCTRCREIRIHYYGQLPTINSDRGLTTRITTSD